jgi:hypothetical protein
MAKSSSAERRLIELWVGLRLFTLAWAAFIAPIRPLTDRERLVPLWPPSIPYTSWIERVVFAPWERWDAHIFVESVSNGFSLDSGSASFHPLLPMLAGPFAVIFTPIVGLWLVASIASLTAVIALYRLARLDLPEASSETACILFLAFPVSAVMFAPYTEPLWIAYAALALLWCRERRWLAAAAAAAGTALTRQQGLFLALPLAWELWEAHGRSLKQAMRDWRGLLAVAAAPIAYGAWVLYRSVALADAQADLSSLNTLIYSTLLSSSSSKVVPVQAMLPPWEALYRAVDITIHATRLNNVLNLALAAVFVALIAIAWPRMRASYRLLTGVVAAVSFAYYTGPAIPYMGLPRHLLLAFPVFIGATPFFEKGRRRFLLAGVFLPAMLLVVMMYVLQAWVP